MWSLNASNAYFNINELYIENINNVYVANQKSLYYFLSFFCDKLQTKLFINGFKIDSKTSLIINMYDIESILNQMQLKKGSLLFDCIMSELEEKVEDTNIKEIIEDTLDSELSKLIDMKIIDYSYSFDVDIFKIISSYINITVDFTFEKYLEDLKNVIKYVVTKNPKKRIILLTNDKLINEKFDDLENIILFKIGSNNNPNILIGNEIVNFDSSLLVNNLLLNWPCELKRDEAEYLIKSFLKAYSLSTNIETKEYFDYIGYKLISNYLSLKVKIEYIKSDEKIPLLYEKYINTLLEKEKNDIITMY